MIDLKIAFGRLVLFMASLAVAQSSIVEAACTYELKNSYDISRWKKSVDSASGSEELSPPALFRQEKIKPPMGLKEDQMNLLLKMLKDSPYLQAFDVFVIYGSRVHFDFGSKPSTISDLDIATIPKDPSAVSPETYKEARKTASELSAALKVMITFDLRANQSFSDLIQNPDFLTPPPSRNMSLPGRSFKPAQRPSSIML
ncbi:MAG: hypothetical protein IPJ71_03850 [Bdellovibrionales bacterium]|nr:hypothetical protein [Bdellovibrionales bacterium]